MLELIKTPKQGTMMMMMMMSAKDFYKQRSASSVRKRYHPVKEEKKEAVEYQRLKKKFEHAFIHVPPPM